MKDMFMFTEDANTNITAASNTTANDTTTSTKMSIDNEGEEDNADDNNDDEPPTFIPNITGAILEKTFAWATQHKHDLVVNNGSNLSDWDLEFFNVSFFSIYHRAFT